MGSKRGSIGNTADQWNNGIIAADLPPKGNIYKVNETKTPDHKNTLSPPPPYSTNGDSAHEDHDIANPEDIISIPRKLALACGAAPLIFPIVTATIFINMFLLEIAGLTARNVSVVLFVGRAFDAISDPIVGVLVNKTQQKGSSLRRWMMGALPFLIFSYFALWQTFDTSSNYIKVLFYTLVYIVLQVAFTVYSVPYSALIMYQTNNRKERDIATAFRMSAEIMFGVFAVGIMGAIIGNTGADLDCDTEAAKEESLEHSKDMYFISSLIIISIVFITGIITYVGTKERSDIRLPSSKTPIWKATKQVLGHKPYFLLMSSYFCMFLAVSIVQGNFQTYFKYSLNKTSEFTIAVIILMITGGLGVPLWQFVVNKFGKKKAVYVGVIIIVPSLLSLAFVPDDLNIVFVYGVCFVAGFGLGSGYFMPWSMLPDVIDDYILQYNESHESIFYGFFVFFNKFAAGIGLGVSVLFLDLSGYINDECAVQPEAVDTTLRLLCAPGPAVLVLLYCLLIFLYPLNEAKCRENKEALQAKSKRDQAIRQHQQYVNAAYDYLPEYITYL